MSKDKLFIYELLKDFEDPNGKVYAGVRKTEQQWMARFALLNPGDCRIKTDWFKPVDALFSLSEMVDFATCYSTFSETSGHKDVVFYFVEWYNTKHNSNGAHQKGS